MINTVKAETGMFTGVLYSFLEGRKVQKDDWNPGFWEKMGQLLGSLHTLSRNYQIKRGRRPDIFEEFGPTFNENLDESDTIIKQKVESLYRKLKTLPRNNNNWGMIHVDVHSGNFHINDSEIALFDFDDCQFSWYIHDIAMALFYNLPHHCEEPDQIDQGHRFLNSFMKNRKYKLENDVPYFSLDTAKLEQNI